MADDWTKNLVTDEDAIREILETSERVAVLGIKTEEQSDKAAFYVPAYLADHGYDVIPVPVYYPEATEILGRKVYRAVADVPGPIDVVDVFRRPEDIPPHVDDLIAARPEVVWFQLGITNDEAAERLAKAGIRVVQDHCMMADHKRWLG